MTKKQFCIQTIAFVLACLALPILLACDKNCEEHEGVCACDAPPKDLVPVTEVKPSDEKPRREQIREWESGEVHAEIPPSQAVNDIKMDAEKARAESQGKHTAGLN